MPKSPGYTHVHPAESPDTGAELTGGTYDGFLLELTAITTFYFLHEGNNQMVLVTPGIDYSSHQNIEVKDSCP
ncbi:hypothetical protein DSTSK_40500 [Desulforhabdus sp. TSK]|nr:hypothetical protein DSTSK_40500 [Desulforhabdus sp. TSK]